MCKVDLKHATKRPYWWIPAQARRRLLRGSKEHLGGLDVKWDAIRHILVTHGHYDHFRMAAQIVERSGALVWVHPADRKKLTSVSLNPFFVDQEPAIQFFGKLGVSKAEIASVMSETETMERGTKPLPEIGSWQTDLIN